MAATLIDDVPARIGGLDRVYECAVEVTNPGIPVEVLTPHDSANRLWVLGYFQSADVAADITFSTTTKTRTLKLDSYQGVWDKAGVGYAFVGKPGEAINFDATVPIEVTLLLGEGSVFYGVNG